jgi:hypothetical protein
MRIVGWLVPELQTFRFHLVLEPFLIPKGSASSADRTIVVLLATSLYLLTQDLRRELLSTGTGE